MLSPSRRSAKTAADLRLALPPAAALWLRILLERGACSGAGGLHRRVGGRRLPCCGACRSSSDLCRSPKPLPLGLRAAATVQSGLGFEAESRAERAEGRRRTLRDACRRLAHGRASAAAGLSSAHLVEVALVDRVATGPLPPPTSIGGVSASRAVAARQQHEAGQRPGASYRSVHGASRRPVLQLTHPVPPQRKSHRPSIPARPDLCWAAPTCAQLPGFTCRFGPTRSDFDEVQAVARQRLRRVGRS